MPLGLVESLGSDGNAHCGIEQMIWAIRPQFVQIVNARSSFAKGVLLSGRDHSQDK
jgi:hypothetical protein